MRITLDARKVNDLAKAIYDDLRFICNDVKEENEIVIINTYPNEIMRILDLEWESFNGGVDGWANGYVDDDDELGITTGFKITALFEMEYGKCTLNRLLTEQEIDLL